LRNILICVNVIKRMRGGSVHLRWGSTIQKLDT